ncbi:LON peptidase substrate-binding domain-containing protein [Chitinophagaceae bacterium LWZ2-11]
MTNFIPIFPLGIVVYPGEQLNLHIFEPRYKQLITECYAEAKPFGIPTVLDSGVAELGTSVNVTEIVEVYEDGKLDIRVQALEIFRILEIVKKIPDKLYSGAIVSYPDNDVKKHTVIIRKVVSSIKELHRLLNISKDFKKKENELLSYDIAHHAGLSIAEEYELLSLMTEVQRLEYLKRHLKKILPMISGIENLKEKIQLNGHFRELKGFNFDL